MIFDSFKAGQGHRGPRKNGMLARGQKWEGIQAMVLRLEEVWLEAFGLPTIG